MAPVRSASKQTWVPARFKRRSTANPVRLSMSWAKISASRRFSAKFFEPTTMRSSAETLGAQSRSASSPDVRSRRIARPGPCRRPDTCRRIRCTLGRISVIWEPPAAPIRTPIGATGLSPVAAGGGRPPCRPGRVQATPARDLAAGRRPSGKDFPRVLFIRSPGPLRAAPGRTGRQAAAAAPPPGPSEGSFLHASPRSDQRAERPRPDRGSPGEP